MHGDRSRQRGHVHSDGRPGEQRRHRGRDRRGGHRLLLPGRRHDDRPAEGGARRRGCRDDVCLQQLQRRRGDDDGGCWADKSGQANNAPQSTSGYRPTLTTVNGRSVPGFDGVDDYLPLTVSKLPTGTTSSTMAMTAKLTGTVGYRNLMSWVR